MCAVEQVKRIGVSVNIMHLHQDDPTKCTAVKLKKFGLVGFSYKTRRGLLLDPFATYALSAEDRRTIDREGLVAVDGSWKLVDSTFRKVRWPEHKRRALPYLIAANPTNFGTPCKLSTAEAIGAALYITGYYDESHLILEPFRWGGTFFQLNGAYLESYAHCMTHTEVIKAQKQIMEGRIVAKQ